MSASRSEWENKTDEQLSKDAEHGRTGQGAIPEAMRRLRVKIEILSEKTDKYSKWLIALTFVIGIIALLQLITFIC